MLQVITHIYIVKNKECASHVFVVCLAKKCRTKTNLFCIFLYSTFFLYLSIDSLISVPCISISRIPA